MKSTIITLGLFLTAILGQAQTNEKRNVSSFSKIEVKDPIELIYTEGEAPAINVTGNAGQLANVSTEINDGMLKIQLKDTKEPMEKYTVYVTGHDLSSLKASKNAVVNVTNQISAPEFSLTLSSGAQFSGSILTPKSVSIKADDSTFYKGFVQTDAVYGDFSDQAKAILTGNAQTAMIKTNHYALCDAGNFSAEKLFINAREYSTTKIYAKKNIDIHVGESARVTYSGKPSEVKMNENAVGTNGKMTKTVIAAK
ncbi:GIN domain-containing protein [Flavobacterium sp.]|uniref:GIN domain-containing protein n=1 Tax=Flavobacterium sp. TaxID=239 RepID=UPI0039E60438